MIYLKLDLHPTKICKNKNDRYQYILPYYDLIKQLYLKLLMGL